MRQHYLWPKMRDDIVKWTKPCHECQLGKRGGKGYGKVPEKDVERGPWKDISVDLAGKWKARHNGKQIDVHVLTIIDVFTGWMECCEIQGKTARHVMDILEQEWLRRYPRPEPIIYDQGGEFDNAEMVNLAKKWYNKRTPITMKNPRANAIVERMHFTLGNKLRAQLASKHKYDNPVREIISAATYGIRATVHGVTVFSPGQLVFGRDMILQTNIETDMELVRQRRQRAITQNTARENRSRIAHRYKAGDQVLILTQKLDQKLKLHEGPYDVLGYSKAHGTLHIRRRHYTDSINVRLVRPQLSYHNLVEPEICIPVDCES